MKSSSLSKLFTISLQFTVYSLIALALINCSGGRMEPSKTTFPSIKDVPAEAWQGLAQKRIYFGHQSVGQNILDGISDVMKENPQIKLDIVDLPKVTDFNKPYCAHSGVGKNEDPRSKCEDFLDIMDNKIKGKVDIAFFKFCYVDIMPTTDVSRLFESYQGALTSLKEKYPKVVFVHVTTPLTSLQTGPKAWIKKLIGKPLRGYDDNIKREQFNSMLRKEHKGKEPIFDLAMIESINPNGRRVSFSQNGTTAYALVPAYTNDGGHLNEIGRKLVAEQLLILLANIANK